MNTSAETEAEKMERMFERFEEIRKKDKEEFDAKIQSLMEKLNGIQIDPNLPNENMPTLTKGDAAEKAQEETPFDEEALYDTLIDPRVREKKHLEDFVLEALTFYKSGQILDVHRVFCNDFRYWGRQHFHSIKRVHLESINDLLMRQGIKVRKDGRFALWKAFGDYLDKIWDLPGEELSIGIVSNPNIPDTSVVQRTPIITPMPDNCLLYTSDAADD